MDNFDWKIRRILVAEGYLFPTTDAEIERALKEFEKMNNNEIVFKAIPVTERQPSEFFSIHFVLLNGRLPMMAQYNPQGWCYLQEIPAQEPPKLIGGKGVTHWLERQ